MNDSAKSTGDSGLGNLPTLLLLQIELIAYVYTRSALFKGIPLSQGELVLMGGVFFLAHRWSWIQSASIENLGRLRAWVPHFAVTATTLILFKSRILEICPYSSDPDNHAYMLKAFVDSGGFFANYPYSDVAMSYTSGFMVLNSIWYWLTPLRTTTTVLFQPLLQYLLFLGALLAKLWPTVSNYMTNKNIRPYQRGWTLILLMAGCFACLSVWNPTFRQNRLFLQGTARLAHGAMLMVPLLFCSAIQEGKWRSQSLLNFLTLSLFCLGFALLLYPAHAPLQFIVAIASAGAMVVSSKLSLATIKALWSRENRVRTTLQILTTGLVFFIMIRADPFFQTSAAPGPNVRDLNEVHQPLVIWSSLADLHSWQQAFTTQLVHSLFHSDWKDALINRGGLLILAAALTLYSLTGPTGQSSITSRRRIVSFLLVPTLIWILGSISLSLIQQFVDTRTVSGAMIREYSQAGQYQALVLAFIWLVFSLIENVLKIHSERHQKQSSFVHRSTLALIAFCLGFALHEAPHFWKKFIRPPFATGKFDRKSLQLVDFIEKNVSTRKGERVLLSSYIMENDREAWVFASGTAKAVALFGRVPTAFFNLMDGSDFTANNWKAHLGSNFDLGWLKNHRIAWYVDGDVLVIPNIQSVASKQFCLNPGESSERCVWKFK